MQCRSVQSIADIQDQVLLVGTQDLPNHESQNNNTFTQDPDYLLHKEGNTNIPDNITDKINKDHMINYYTKKIILKEY